MMQVRVSQSMLETVARHLEDEGLDSSEVRKAAKALRREEGRGTVRRPYQVGEIVLVTGGDYLDRVGVVFFREFGSPGIVGVRFYGTYEVRSVERRYLERIEL